MRITVLVDNHAAPGLASEHGLSLWLATDTGNVLFDTGQGPALESNATALGIPLESAQAIVLSHGHYDHTGGLPFALSRSPSAAVFAHPEVLAQRFSIRDHSPRSIKMPDPAVAVLRSGQTRFIGVTGPTEVLPGVWVTGPIPRRNEFEDTGGPFFLDAGEQRPDPIADDQALWFAAPEGLIVVLGCAHAGVVNTLDYIRELTGRSTVHAVVGGMHLAAASMPRLEKTVEALERYATQVIVPCHCTGDEAVRFLQRRLPGRVTKCAAGRELTFKGDAK